MVTHNMLRICVGKKISNALNRLKLLLSLHTCTPIFYHLIKVPWKTTLSCALTLGSSLRSTLFPTRIFGAFLLPRHELADFNKAFIYIFGFLFDCFHQNNWEKNISRIWECMGSTCKMEKEQNFVLVLGLDFCYLRKGLNLNK